MHKDKAGTAAMLPQVKENVVSRKLEEASRTGHLSLWESWALFILWPRTSELLECWTKVLTPS